MIEKLRSHAEALFASLVSDDWANDAIQWLQKFYQRQIEAGQLPLICKLNVLSKAFGMVWRELFWRGLQYMTNATFIPALRIEGDPRWYAEYAAFLGAVGVSYVTLMALGGIVAYSSGQSFLPILIIATSFSVAAAVFAVGKIAYGHGEFIFLAAAFYFLPMAIVVSAPGSAFVGMLFQNHLAGWIAFAAQLSLWMTIALREFHDKWLQRPSSE